MYVKRQKLVTFKNPNRANADCLFDRFDAQKIRENLKGGQPENDPPLPTNSARSSGTVEAGSPEKTPQPSIDPQGTIETDELKIAVVEPVAEAAGQ